MHVHSEVFSYAIEKVNSSFELHSRKKRDFEFRKINKLILVFLSVYPRTTDNQSIISEKLADVANKICFGRT
jgi:hypothetical protein